MTQIVGRLIKTPYRSDFAVIAAYSYKYVAEDWVDSTRNFYIPFLEKDGLCMIKH